MTLHLSARQDDRVARSRRLVVAAGVVAGLILAIDLVGAAAAAATGAAWGGAPSPGPSNWLVYEQPITP